MPKVEEFYPSRASRREPLGRTTGSNDWVERLGRTIILKKDGAQRNHNFRHFSSF